MFFVYVKEDTDNADTFSNVVLLWIVPKKREDPVISRREPVAVHRKGRLRALLLDGDGTELLTWGRGYGEIDPTGIGRAR